MVSTEACAKKPSGAKVRHKAGRNGKARRSGEANMAFQTWKPHGCLAWSRNGHKRCRFTCPYNTGEQTTPSAPRTIVCEQVTMETFILPIIGHTGCRWRNWVATCSLAV